MTEVVAGRMLCQAQLPALWNQCGLNNICFTLLRTVRAWLKQSSLPIHYLHSPPSSTRDINSRGRGGRRVKTSDATVLRFEDCKAITSKSQHELVPRIIRVENTAKYCTQTPASLSPFKFSFYISNYCYIKGSLLDLLNFSFCFVVLAVEKHQIHKKKNTTFAGNAQLFIMFIFDLNCLNSWRLMFALFLSERHCSTVQ